MLTPADLPPRLRLLATPRTQILDDRQYTVERRGSQARFRLQLYTAPPHVRPVAVAVQDPMADPGASLMNAAESYAAAVWKEHFPQHSQPPLWIARMFLSDSVNQSLTSFEVVEKYRLRSPTWAPLSDEEIQVLVGAEVALTRR